MSLWPRLLFGAVGGAISASVISGWSVGAGAAGSVIGILCASAAFAYFRPGYEESRERWARMSAEERRGAWRETSRGVRRTLLFLAVPSLAAVALMVEAGTRPDPAKVLLFFFPVLVVVALCAVAEWKARG